MIMFCQIDRLNGTVFLGSVQLVFLTFKRLYEDAAISSICLCCAIAQYNVSCNSNRPWLKGLLGVLLHQKQVGGQVGTVLRDQPSDWRTNIREVSWVIFDLEFGATTDIA